MNSKQYPRFSPFFWPAHDPTWLPGRRQISASRGGDREPAAGLELRLKLTRTPAGIAQGEDAIARTLSLTDGAHNLDISRDCQTAAHNARPLVGIIVAVEDKGLTGLDRTTVMDDDLPFGLLALCSETFQEVRDRALCQRPVDNQAHSAIFVVLDHIDDGVGKMGVGHFRH